ncbi:MAG: hypothetical protein AAFV32_02825 [Myxococcota bacterium]
MGSIPGNLPGGLPAAPPADDESAPESVQGQETPRTRGDERPPEDGSRREPLNGARTEDSRLAAFGDRMVMNQLRELGRLWAREDALPPTRTEVEAAVREAGLSPRHANAAFEQATVSWFSARFSSLQDFAAMEYPGSEALGNFAHDVAAEALGPRASTTKVELFTRRLADSAAAQRSTLVESAQAALAARWDDARTRLHMFPLGAERYQPLGDAANDDVHAEAVESAMAELRAAALERGLTESEIDEALADANPRELIAELSSREAGAALLTMLHDHSDDERFAGLRPSFAAELDARYGDGSADRLREQFGAEDFDKLAALHLQAGFPDPDFNIAEPFGPAEQRRMRAWVARYNDSFRPEPPLDADRVVRRASSLRYQTLTVMADADETSKAMVLAMFAYMALPASMMLASGAPAATGVMTRTLGSAGARRALMNSWIGLTRGAVAGAKSGLMLQGIFRGADVLRAGWDAGWAEAGGLVVDHGDLSAMFEAWAAFDRGNAAAWEKVQNIPNDVSLEAVGWAALGGGVVQSVAAPYAAMFPQMGHRLLPWIYAQGPVVAFSSLMTRNELMASGQFTETEAWAIALTSSAVTSLAFTSGVRGASTPEAREMTREMLSAGIRMIGKVKVIASPLKNLISLALADDPDRTPETAVNAVMLEFEGILSPPELSTLRTALLDEFARASEVGVHR